MLLLPSILPFHAWNHPAPAGLSQAKRKILSEGLVSNAATLLDFSPGAGNGASPASLMPGTMGAANSSSKRKRSGMTVASEDFSGKGKASKFMDCAECDISRVQDRTA